jgi:hypothetical protein
MTQSHDGIVLGVNDKIQYEKETSNTTSLFTMHVAVANFLFIPYLMNEKHAIHLIPYLITNVASLLANCSNVYSSSLWFHLSVCTMLTFVWFFLVPWDYFPQLQAPIQFYRGF